jgi:nucleoid-associated protein YgaU
VNARALALVGILAGGVAAAVVLGSSGTDAPAGPPRVYRGLGNPPPSGPAAPATAAAPDGTPAPTGTPAAPVATAAPPTPLRPGDTRGATDEVAGAGASPLSAPRTEGRARTTYVVPGGGQSVYAVARALLGDADRWREVYEANRAAIADPERIPGGTVLDVPTGGDGASRFVPPKLGGGIR